ncbi:hypothetical protein J7L06_03505 [Candidatus Bathyarchaeota archaeon]|nr:hypothetical protein [Candidatus Bathyarchaeota archaeon]
MEGARNDVLNTLESIPELLTAMSTSLQTIAQTKVKAPQTTETTKPREEYPTLSLPPNASCPDVIVELLKTSWGRKAPRTLNEIMEAMKLNALHYPKGTVSGRLADMTKKGVLRRIQTEKGYGYILIKP